MVKLDLNAKIEGRETEKEVKKLHMRTTQNLVVEKDQRIPGRSQTLPTRHDVSTLSSLKTIENSAKYRRRLLTIILMVVVVIV